MPMFRLLIVATMVALVSGCFTKTEYIHRSYPQYIVTDVAEFHKEPIAVPELSVDRNTFAKMSSVEQRDLLAYTLVDVIAALKKANDRILAIVQTQQKKQEVVEATNEQIRKELKDE